jgi:hypothetical protein
VVFLAEPDLLLPKHDLGGECVGVMERGALLSSVPTEHNLSTSQDIDWS